VSFKSYFGLWFHQGALLEDNKGFLINAAEGKTQGLRQWRMSSPKDIKSAEIKKYLQESIDHSKSGRVIKSARTKPVIIDLLVEEAFGSDPVFAVGFKNLRPGIQREYAEHITDAKRLTTKKQRIEKNLYGYIRSWFT
jgi:uncharacterized protein YdeI (YjbR/CyaY-like superfamily)